MAEPKPDPKFTLVEYFDYLFQDLDLPEEEAHARIYAVTGQHPSMGTVDGSTPLDMGAVAEVEEQAAQGVKFAELQQAPMSFPDPGAIHQTTPEERQWFSEEEGWTDDPSVAMAPAPPQPAPHPVLGVPLEATEWPPKTAFGSAVEGAAESFGRGFKEAMPEWPGQAIDAVGRARELGLREAQQAGLPTLTQPTTAEGQPVYTDPSQDPFYQRMEGQFPVPEPSRPGSIEHPMHEARGTGLLKEGLMTLVHPTMPTPRLAPEPPRETFPRRTLEEAREAADYTPPVRRDDPIKWGTRVVASGVGLVRGGFKYLVEAGENISDLADEWSRFEASRISEQAYQAKKRGDESVTVELSSPGLFGNETETVTVNVDDVIQDDAKYAENRARLMSRSSVMEKAHHEYMEHLKDLTDHHDLLDVRTLRLWREGMAEMVSGLGQLILLFSGVKPHDEPAEASIAETFAATSALVAPLAERLPADAIAGFAMTFHSPDAARRNFQAYGPIVVAELLPYLRGIKSLAMAGKASLPPAALQRLDTVIAYGDSIVDAIADSPIPVFRVEGGVSLRDAGHAFKRKFVDAASNREPLAEDFYNTSLREAAEQQRAVENALSIIANEAAEGRVSLKARERLADAERGLYESEIPHWQQMVDEMYEDALKDEGLAVERVDPDVPDVVNEKVQRRVDDPEELFSVDEIREQEMAAFVDEGGVLTSRRTLPGTKEEGYVHYDLSVDDATLWDAVMREKDRQRKRVIDRWKESDPDYAGKLVRDIEVARKKELRDIGEGIHQRQKLITAPDARLAALRKKIEKEAADYIRDRRSAFGITGRIDPQEGPIQSTVYTAEAVIDLADGSASYKTVSRKELAEFEESVKHLPPGEQAARKRQFLGEGRYRGIETRQAGEQVITPRPEYSRRARAARDRVVDIMGDTPEARLRIGAEIDANVARSVDQMLAEWTRSPTARNRLAKELTGIIVARARKSAPISRVTRIRIEANVAKLLDEAQGRKTPESGAPGSALPHNIEFEVKLPDGKTLAPINLIDEVAGIVMKDGKTASRIMSESIHQTAVRAGIRHAQQVMRRTYEAEVSRGYDAAKAMGKGTPDFTTEGVRSVASILEEGSLPAMLLARPSDIFGDIGSALSGRALNQMVSDVNRVTGKKYTAAQVQSAITQTRRRVRKYRDFSDRSYKPARNMMNVGDDVWEGQRGYGTAGGRRLPMSRREVDLPATTLHGISPETGLPRTWNKLPDPDNPGEYLRTPDGTIKEGVVGGSVYVQKNLAEALNNYGKAQDAVTQAGLALTITTMIKSHLTARQITTLKNNFLSNVALQSIRRGSATVLPDLIKSIVEYKKYQQGYGHLTDAERARLEYLHDPSRYWELSKKEAAEADALAAKSRAKMSDEDVEMFDSLSMSGKINTSMVDGELGGMLKGGIMGSLIRNGYLSPSIAKYLEKLDLPMAKLEDIYRFSDEAFKIDEGIRSWKIIDSWEKKLKPGEFIELRIGPTKKVRATKRADGSFEVDGKALNKTQWNTLKGKAAMQVGEDLFFNYLDVPDHVRWARTNYIVAALGSPFYTWLNKAMDLPGVKRGLVAETLTGTPFVRTDSLAIQGDVFGRQATIGAAISVIQAGNETAPYDREVLRDLRKIQGWGNQEQAMVINHTLKGQLQGYSLMQANPYSATSLAFRALESGILAIGDAVNLAKGEKIGRDSWVDAADDIIKQYQDHGADLDWRKITRDMADATDEERKRVGKIRKFLVEKDRETGRIGIGLADSLDFIGMAGHPLLEIWVLAAQEEAQGKNVYWGRFGRRAANMLLGGTYAKSLDVAGASELGEHVPGMRAFSSRYDFADPLSGEGEEYIRWGIRNVTGLGWKPQNLHKRGGRYFEKLKQRWGDSLVAPVLRAAKTSKNEWMDVENSDKKREEARQAHIQQVTTAKKLWAIVKAETNIAFAQHFKLMEDAGIHEETLKGYREYARKLNAGKLPSDTFDGGFWRTGTPWNYLKGSKEEGQ